MSISLADRSIKYPRVIVENLLVKIGKFFFPVDFVILDMEVDDGVPLILGHPFLRTAKAVIDDDYWDSNPLEDDVDGDVGRMKEEPPNWLEEFEKKLVGSTFLSASDDEFSLNDILPQVEMIVCETRRVEILESTLVEPPLSEPLLVTVVHSERVSVESTPSSDHPRSRPPREKTRELIDLGNLDRVQTPSVGMSRGDNLLGYLLHIIFGPGRFKLWWKDRGNRYEGYTMLGNSRLIRCGISSGMKFQSTRGTRRWKGSPSRYCSACPNSISIRAGRMLLSLCNGNPVVCATVTEMLYGAHKEERSCTFDGDLENTPLSEIYVLKCVESSLCVSFWDGDLLDLSYDSIADFFEDEKRLSVGMFDDSPIIMIINFQPFRRKKKAILRLKEWIEVQRSNL
ncbi:hypothetical protein L1987_54693 [Smallanthus sonchifolius]|uniref:Uncharacterized protein n=1 Tax=Smallanthus sonchifolius TaxID=185202 RepID=A0ACB9E8X5_9ASTR|nr:hypothetical protein L1987_54693 [Smallanthus sonchifolius]